MGRPRRHRIFQGRYDALEALREDRGCPRHAGVRRSAGAGDRGGEEVAGDLTIANDSMANRLHPADIGVQLTTLVLMPDLRPGFYI